MVELWDGSGGGTSEADMSSDVSCASCASCSSGATVEPVCDGPSLPPVFDVITYAGPVTVEGYERLSELIAEEKSHDVVVLVIATPGGDPHAAFRIARTLQQSYERFYALVPRYCKSAGTLIVLGAHGLFMDEMSELGPLDTQVRKADELIGLSSTLEFVQVIENLQEEAVNLFRGFLHDLAAHGLSTRMAAEVAVGLTTGMVDPIIRQVDPFKLVEMRRAAALAFEYGTRLSDSGRNLRSRGLHRLIHDYPSHAFAIDRREAGTLFVEVGRIGGPCAEIQDGLGPLALSKGDADAATVDMFHFPIKAKEALHDEIPTEGSDVQGIDVASLGGCDQGGGAAPQGRRDVQEAARPPLV